MAPAADPLTAIVPAGQGYPSWAEGRTFKDVLSLSGQMYGLLQQQIQQPQTHAPAPAQAPVSSVQFGDDDYVQGAQMKSWLDQQAQTRFMPQIQNLHEVAAQNTLALAKERHAEAFKRWGPEISTALANVPKEQWSLPMLDKVVRFVQSEHLDELVETRVRERTQQTIQDMGSTGMRSNGAPGVGTVPNHNPVHQHTLADPDVNPEWKAAAEKAGLTEAQIDGFCRATGDTREQFFARLKSGSVKAVARG